jgi:hypothetical protein
MDALKGGGEYDTPIPFDWSDIFWAGLPGPPPPPPRVSDREIPGERQPTGLGWRPSIVRDKAKLDMVWSTFAQYNFSAGYEFDAQGAVTLHNAPFELKLPEFRIGGEQVRLHLFSDPTVYLNVGVHYFDPGDSAGGNLRAGVVRTPGSARGNS